MGTTKLGGTVKVLQSFFAVTKIVILMCSQLLFIHYLTQFINNKKLHPTRLPAVPSKHVLTYCFISFAMCWDLKDVEYAHNEEEEIQVQTYVSRLRLCQQHFTYFAL